MTDKLKENKEEILLALAILLGGLSKALIKKADDFSSLPDFVLKAAIAEFAKHEDTLQEFVDAEKLSHVELQEEMALIGQQQGSKVFIIENPGDGRTCERCRQWIGQKVSDIDPNYPSVQDWIRGGGLHYGCRCSLHAVEEIDDAHDNAIDYLQRKEARLAEAAAFNSIPLSRLTFN